MHKTISIRRSLFSAPSNSRRKLFCGSNEDKVIICQDCGHEHHTSGSSTDVVCPNCGGHRFNFPSKRRSLFSSLTNIETPNGVGTFEGNDEQTFRCPDCGQVFSAIPEGVICPNCGGSRVVLISECEDDEKEKDFSAIDELLDKYSGKTVETSEVQKIFSEHGVNDLLNSGYASEVEPGQICFSENSAAIRKLFSKLVISITKELDLPDPIDKDALMQNLSTRLPEKGMMIIRKIHGITPVSCCSPEEGLKEDYLHDSGIVGDLKIEHGGSSMPIRDFMNILDSRYNDAPENIMDQLVKRGTIRISGAKVDVL